MLISGIKLTRPVTLEFIPVISIIGNVNSELFDTTNSSQINNFNKLGKLIKFQSAIQNARNYICKLYNLTISQFNKSVINKFSFDFTNQKLGINFINPVDNIGHEIYLKFTGEVHPDQGDKSRLQYELDPSDLVGIKF